MTELTLIAISAVGALVAGIGALAASVYVAGQVSSLSRRMTYVQQITPAAGQPEVRSFQVTPDDEDAGSLLDELLENRTTAMADAEGYIAEQEALGLRMTQKDKERVRRLAAQEV